MALTQDQLSQLYSRFLAGNYGLTDSGYSPMAVTHSGEDMGAPSQLLGYGGNYSGMTPGSTYDLYDPTGQSAGQRKLLDGGSYNLSDFKDLEQAAATMLAAYAGGQGLMALGAGSAGGIGGSGFAAGGTGAGGLTGAIDPALAVQGNSINALDASTGAGYGSTAAGSGAAMGGGGAAGGAGSTVGGYGSALDAGMTAPAASTGAFNSALAASSGSPLAGLAAALGVSPSILGMGAAALGAVAGSKPVQTTATKDIPAFLKPYVTGQGGLLDSAQNLFQQQTAPGALPGYTRMQNVGMGLLSQPVAGNGSQQFASRPRFGG